MTDEVTICPGVEKVGWGGRNFTSRILVGLVARSGFVEAREGIGCRQCRSACLAGRSVTLQAVGPAAGGVVDARNHIAI